MDYPCKRERESANPLPPPTIHLYVAIPAECGIGSGYGKNSDLGEMSTPQKNTLCIAEKEGGNDCAAFISLGISISSVAQHTQPSSMWKACIHRQMGQRVDDIG